MEELIDFMTTAKMEHKEYDECMEHTEDEDLKEMYRKLAENEKEAYHIMKDYILGVVAETEER